MFKVCFSLFFLLLFVFLLLNNQLRFNQLEAVLVEVWSEHGFRLFRFLIRILIVACPFATVLLVSLTGRRCMSPQRQNANINRSSLLSLQWKSKTRCFLFCQCLFNLLRIISIYTNVQFYRNVTTKVQHPKHRSTRTILQKRRRRRRC